MLIITTAALALALQQGLASTPGLTTPPSGDTAGYWQQRVAYTITATLDERAHRVRARGTMRYVNNSPDTLREMYVHQYLNAFRPASKWSDVDEREGRDRFQRLRDPDYGYERLTAPLLVDGVAVRVDYPGAPDSTVAHFMLPAPLAPRDSLEVAFEWDARPSTVPRRQGRRGRHWDLAQWYPKVAVYDRGGWQPNALQPAGELYGEFGTYDVTLVLAEDQVVAATGVPVSGDPGWSRAMREGISRSASRAYSALPPAPVVDVPAGHKAVRFFARDVHHFAWSASPDYRYEGGAYVRAVSGVHWPTWDTVSVHALYRPGDDTTWGRQKVVRRTIAALQWLESIYGPYAYPQMTVLHRLDGGGTEFPMMQMNGSPSQGLILHEGGHVFTYGILANNEWRSGWMDEGLTSYQSEWAQRFTPQERVEDRVVAEPIPVHGYRGLGIRMALTRFDAEALDQTFTELEGRAEPIGTVAHEFRDFATYNDMIYNRAQLMYGQLRDALGDSLFRAFLQDYYHRWSLKHVDERAMRASAERVSGRDLGWFFDQWVHHTGVTDYSLDRVSSSRQASGGWLTEAVVRRRGEYRHLMLVGVRTATGWTLAQTGNERPDDQTVRIATSDEPLEIRLDPFHYSADWNRRNDVARPFRLFRTNRGRSNFDWPFLLQADRERDVQLFRPMAWYSDPGGATLGLRVRTSYLGWLDQGEFGFVTPLRQRGLMADQKLQFWSRMENPTAFRRPLIGWRLRAALLDDIQKLDVGHRGESRAGLLTRSHDIALTYTDALHSELLPELWSLSRTFDLDGRVRWQRGRASGSYLFAQPRIVLGVAQGDGAYGKAEVSVGGIREVSETARLGVRAFGGFADERIPARRGLFLSSADPISTFENHWWRPRGSILKQAGVNWLPLGGAGLRGFHWEQAARGVLAANVDASRRLAETSRTSAAFGLWFHGFADAATTTDDEVLVDAGIGLSMRGRLYDHPFVIRLDSPFFVNRPVLALDRAGSGQVAPRWAISFNDLW